MESTSARIRLIKVTGSSLDVEIFAYVLETDQAAFLAIQEELLLGIMDIIDPSAASAVEPLRDKDLAKDGSLAKL